METQILGDTLSRTVVGDGDDVFEGMFTDRVLVEKRDGRVVDFDPVNIVVAVKSAFADLDKEVGPQEERMILDIANQIEGEIRERYNGPAKIEDIQNLVEHALIEDHLYEVARTYTNYRLNKDIQRAKATDINEAVSRLVNRDESLVRENANKDSNVYATQRDLLAGAVSKASAFSMLPDAVANAHMKGDIHFHDADYSPFTSMNNCSLPDFGDMLKHGFALGNAMMDSPKSIGTASTQITQIIKDIAGAQYGGQTVNRADEMLEEYAKRDYVKNLDMAHAMIPDSTPIEVARDMVAGLKAQEPRWLHFENREPLPADEAFDTNAPELEQIREIYAKIMTRKAIYDAMQTMEYQINSNRVSNGQTPFVTVGFGLGMSWFAREIQRAILLNRIRGLGKERHTAIFPKLVFTVKHGVNADEGDPNLDLKNRTLYLRNLEMRALDADMKAVMVYRADSVRGGYTGFDFKIRDINIAKLVDFIPSMDTIVPMLRSFEGRVQFDVAAEARLDSNMNIRIPTLRSAMYIKGDSLVLMDGETFAEISKMLMFKNKKKNVFDSIYDSNY